MTGKLVVKVLTHYFLSLSIHESYPGSTGMYDEEIPKKKKKWKDFLHVPYCHKTK